MTINDIAAVVAIEQQAFPTPWCADGYRRELLHNERSHYWVLRPSISVTEHPWPPVLAYGGYWLLGDEVHIITIATHPGWRRSGLAEWLLLEMLAQARSQGVSQVTLEVRVGNQAARALYAKLGFEEVGLRKRYYRDNHEDALLMTLFRLEDSTVWRPLLQRLAERQAAGAAGQLQPNSTTAQAGR
jgi:ribosomal-protein-alanine N-acetyltransferase